MPSIRSFASKRRTRLATSISLNGEIINPYFRYAKKGLVYIIIAELFSYHPSFYIKYTKSNTRTLCNVRLISLDKCICPAYYISF